MFDTIGGIFRHAEPSQQLAWANFGSIKNTVAVVINLVTALGFMISMVAITFSMVMYVLSGGDPDKTKRAWSAFLYGVIGAALSLGVFALKNIVVRAFGITDTSIIDGPTGF